MKKAGAVTLLITMLTGLANEGRVQITENTRKVTTLEAKMESMHEDIKIIKEYLIKRRR